MSWWSPYMTSLGTVIIGRSRIPFHRPTRGTVHGQVKLATFSSNKSPENKIEPQARLSILILSKAYPTKGILSPLSRHARLLAWGVWFAKSSKSRSLIAGFSFQVLVQLTILGEHLSNSIHGGKQISFNIQPIIFIIIIFHFLLYVAEGLSSPKLWEADDSNRIC